MTRCLAFCFAVFLARSRGKVPAHSPADRERAFRTLSARALLWLAESGGQGEVRTHRRAVESVEQMRMALESRRDGTRVAPDKRSAVLPSYCLYSVSVFPKIEADKDSSHGLNAGIVFSMFHLCSIPGAFSASPFLCGFTFLHRPAAVRANLKTLAPLASLRSKVVSTESRPTAPRYTGYFERRHCFAWRTYSCGKAGKRAPAGVEQTQDAHEIQQVAGTRRTRSVLRKA
jgi:hypothetical protein